MVSTGSPPSPPPHHWLCRKTTWRVWRKISSRSFKEASLRTFVRGKLARERLKTAEWWGLGTGDWRLVPDSLSCATLVDEELVDFYDWMVDSSHPNGLVVTDELELIRQHPEYLELSSEPPEKQAKLSLRPAASDASVSAVNTPIVTDVGSEVESQAGQESAQRSPAFDASPTLSADDDKDVDDLEDDILGGMEVKPAQPGTDGRRLVVVANGLDRDRDRDGETSRQIPTDALFVALVRVVGSCSTHVVPVGPCVLAPAASARQAAQVAAGRRARRERVRDQSVGQLERCRHGTTPAAEESVRLATSEERVASPLLPCRCRLTLSVGILLPSLPDCSVETRQAAARDGTDAARRDRCRA